MAKRRAKRTATRTATKTAKNIAKPRAGHPDPIRIVPLHGRTELAAAAKPKLTYRKGPLIPAVEVFTIFWGSGWKTPPQSALIPKLNGFFDFILTSPLMDQLAEYNAGAFKIRHGRRTGSATVTTKSPGTSVTDAAIQTFLEQQSTQAKQPKASPNTLYFLYLPPGVRVVMGGSSSCQAFCGYHNATKSGSVLRGDAVSGLQRLHRQPVAVRRA